MEKSPAALAFEANLDQPLQSSEDEVQCMFVPGCDTGSQLRKAISHIFGRNKAATRSIPMHVWVHFCRKHYQRSRYRNAQEWACIQCELVGKQVRRVQTWSDQNRKAGKGGVVQSWTLAMRKREQNRVQEKSSRQRPYQSANEDDDEDSHPDSATLNGTAVPDWLRDKCGDGYSSAEIEVIVAQIKIYVEEVQASQIPDIEILPNITVDPTDDTASRPMLKRKTVNAQSHRRSQSVGVALQTESQPTLRRISQPIPHYDSYPVLRRDSQSTPHQDGYSATHRDGYSITHRDGHSTTHRDGHSLIHHEGQHVPHRDKPHIPSISDLHFPPRDGRPVFDHHNRPIYYRDSQPTYWSTDELPPADKRQRLPDIRDDRPAPHQRSLSAIDSYHPNFSFYSPMPPSAYRTEQPVRFPEAQSTSAAPGPYERNHDPGQTPSRWSLASRPLESGQRPPGP